MENLTEERKHFESLGAIYPAHNQVTIEKIIRAGVETYRFIPPQVTGPETIVFLHGGAYKYGSIRSHQAMVSHVAAATCRIILYVEYSLAPEHRFPQALHDVTAVIGDLITNHEPFALMGDSAGGNLTMSTALNLKKLQMASPLYQVVISPWLNMSTDAQSYIENEKNDTILSKEGLKRAAAAYTDATNFTNPLVSPVLGSFEGFPPTLTLVGTSEILRDDSLALHRALENAGSVSILKTFDHVKHVWPLTDITSAQSVEALQIIKTFVASQVSVPTAR